MPRLLLVTFCYPPTEIIGAIRPAALAKYLPQFGWDPVILTPKISIPRLDSGIVETAQQDILAYWKARLGLDGKRGVHEQLRLPVSSKPGSGLFHTRMLDYAKYFITYPDETKGWIPFALGAIEEMRNQHQKIDAVVTTSPPISAHLIGRKAKTILGCPWVADLRDLWTQNLAHSYPKLASLQIGLEKRTLSEADALVTVSRPWATRLQQLHPSQAILTITNGFDPDEFVTMPKELTREFTVTYAGRLYQGGRDPKILFEVLRDLLDEKIMRPEDVRVRFYGPVESWVTELVQKYRLQEVVNLLGVVTRQEALRRQAESQLLLLLGWTDQRETGQHSGKLFEYLGAARPILAIGGSQGVLSDTLNETRAGTHAFSKEDARSFLITAYSEFKTRGYVPYHGEEAVIGKYTHFQMARRFAEVLDTVCAGPNPTAQAVPALVRGDVNDLWTAAPKAR